MKTIENKRYHQLGHKFFYEYLDLFNRKKIHHTILLYDRDWVGNSLSKMFESLPTNLLMFKCVPQDSPQNILNKNILKKYDEYSVLDFCVDITFDINISSIKFCEGKNNIDVTTMEAARFNLTDKQLEDLFIKVFSESPKMHKERSEIFYSSLEDIIDDKYKISIYSGAKKEHQLIISDDIPWMEICGPVKPGDVRFIPGSEIYYAGSRANGSIACINGAFNLLPFRSSNNFYEKDLYIKLLELGKELENQQVFLEVVNGEVVDIISSGDFSLRYKRIVTDVIGLNIVVEIGIGLSKSALPLIRDWGATTNESALRVHLGLGADPLNTMRFKTNMHVDFFCPEVDVIVNNHKVISLGDFYV